MKNIHILSTERPSRLRYNLSNKLVFTKEMYRDYGKQDNQHMYITNDEAIKETDNVKDKWVLSEYGFVVKADRIKGNYLFHSNGSNDYFWNYKFIILTTDQDLIKDGVQAIDDEFLEWFVKNPSCEYVEVKSWKIDKEWDEIYTQFNPIYPMKNKYKIIIPQEEKCTCENPTDNTCGYCEKENKIEILEEAKKRALEEELEEAANRLFPISKGGLMWMPSTHDCNQANKQEGFIVGAKWQAESMYSEEDLLVAFEAGMMFIGEDKGSFREWFEQYKKK
jgi:hypothetical protein